MERNDLQPYHFLLYIQQRHVATESVLLQPSFLLSEQHRQRKQMPTPKCSTSLLFPRSLSRRGSRCELGFFGFYVEHFTTLPRCALCLCSFENMRPQRIVADPPPLMRFERLRDTLTVFTLSCYGSAHPRASLMAPSMRAAHSWQRLSHPQQLFHCVMMLVQFGVQHF
jgi:hypothetical protein